jgi:trimeric autotransporter adhesin
VTVTALAGGFSQNADIQIYPVNTPRLTGLSLGVLSILGGDSLTGKLTLSGPAGLGGATVQLTSSNLAVQAPSTASLSFGQSSASFNVTTSGVTSQQSATITATFANTTATAMLLVNPALALTISLDAVVGGNPVTGTVTLAVAPASNTTVSLASSNAQFAPVPVSVIVPAGQLSASFTIPTTTVISTRTIIITATYGSASESAALTINPAGLPSPVSVTLNPAIVQGGNSSACKVTLSGPAPAGGLVVNLSTDNPFVAPVPPFVIVSSGQTTVTFAIATTTVSATQTANITASAGGASQSATLTVQ